MAKLSKSEFAEKCGMTSNALAVYIGRKKIFLNESGEIDDQDGKNKLFLQKYSQKAGIKKVTIPEIQSQTKIELDDSEFTELTLEKLKLQVEAQKHDNYKKEQAINKAAGNFIPVSHVELVILHLSEAINLSWENEFEDVLNRIAITHGLTREEITALKKEKVKLSNTSRERAVKEAKKSIRGLQAETSDKRGVGEHG